MDLIIFFGGPKHGRAFKCLVKIQQIVLLTYGSFKAKTIISNRKTVIVGKRQKKSMTRWLFRFFLQRRYSRTDTEMAHRMISLTAHATNINMTTLGASFGRSVLCGAVLWCTVWAMPFDIG